MFSDTLLLIVTNDRKKHVWIQYSVLLDDYEYGLKKAKEAEEETEIGTTDEEEERKQRRIRATRVISSSDVELCGNVA